MSQGYLTNDEVLQRNIQWETYLTARLISDRDLQLIRRFDGSTDTIQAGLVEEDGPAYMEAFMTVLRNVTKEETVQYVLALLEEFFVRDAAHAKLLHAPSQQHPGTLTQPAVIFSRLLNRGDWFTQEKACRMLAIALDHDASVGEGDAAERDDIKRQFLAWLTNQFRRPTSAERSVLVSSYALAGVLRSPAMRKQFAQGVSLLVSVMRSTITGASRERSQVLYQAGLCLWQLSFDEESLANMKTAGVVGVLVDLLKGGNKEKVMRISLLTLKNLMATGDQAVLSDMVDSGLPRLVNIRSAQSWADEDIPPLLEAFSDQLQASLVELSSFEKYRSEVLSGNLEWSPMHSNRAFWQENCAKFEEKDFQVLRVLINLLENSREACVLAVACNDLGQFADVHPHGRHIVNDLGGKRFVMRLMTHADTAVQKHSLLCVQRLMLGRDKLDFLQQAAPAAVEAR